MIIFNETVERANINIRMSFSIWNSRHVGKCNSRDPVYFVFTSCRTICLLLFLRSDKGAGLC